MQSTPSSFAMLADHELIATVKDLSTRERHATAQLIAALAELDARRLYLASGCSSLFTYCTHVLHLSEHAAYGRIEAARAARRFPLVLDLLAEGAITLTTVTLLAPHLTIENHRALLDAARHRSRREVEHQVATLNPRPAVVASIRKLADVQGSAFARSSAPVTAPPTESWPLLGSVAPASKAEAAGDPPSSRVPPVPVSRPATRRPVVEPLASDRYRVQVTLSGETVTKLRRAQDLLRHVIPDGDPATVFDRALTVLLAHLERTKLAATDSPRPSRETRRRSRHIPAAVRRAVWARDEGRCAFVGSEGRCAERGFLEFHHLVPYAAGGEATVDTIALRCRQHNGYEAELEFGPCTLPTAPSARAPSV